jgi:hypothetical protein
MKSFCLVNESSDPAITPDVVLAMAGTMAKQQVRLASFWQRNPMGVAMADTEAAVPSDPEIVLAKFVDVLADPNALAYHTSAPDGRPLILIGVQIVKANVAAGADWLKGPDSLLTAASHELVETFVDPYCDWWWDLDGATEIPLEASDVVQGDAYEEDPGLFVSNFVGPRYFSRLATGPYDAMGLVTVPGQLRAGGYQIRRVGGPAGASSNVFGALPHEGGMPEWKRIAKSLPGTRAHKRAHGVAA